jgi:tetraacyldisaccharide 4'-kinase
MIRWIERFFYAPSLLQRLLAYLLLPLSWLYCFFMQQRFKRAVAKDYAIAVISVGNLNVGGSGKTPLVTALALRFQKSAIVLRGYGRQSKGLHVVSDGSTILCDVYTSGDEAMIYAKKLPHCVVIVAEDRIEGIQKAKALGVEVVFLDDAYSKHHIAKLDLLIDVETPNHFCLPAGPYRERHWKGKNALHVKENIDFTRRVKVENASARMILVTAIARAQRLDAFLPDGVIEKHYFPDHHYFDVKMIRELFERSGADSILVTYKDFVKLEHAGVPLSLLDLELDLSENLMHHVTHYMGTYTR